MQCFIDLQAHQVDEDHQDRAMFQVDFTTHVCYSYHNNHNDFFKVQPLHQQKHNRNQITIIITTLHQIVHNLQQIIYHQMLMVSQQMLILFQM